jgi:hypothetical protein
VELGVDLPSFAKRDPADLPLQLLDALVDLFSQSCSDVIGLGCCGGEGDGVMALGFQRRPSS